MKASSTLIAKIKEFEGCKLVGYLCPARIPTVGVGHTGADVKVGMKITQQQADALLAKDLAKFENYVNKLGVCKTQGQFDSLVDFAYNVGTGNLGSSTLLKYIRAGKPTKDIQAQFMRWNKAKGKVLAGLTKRRAWESTRWSQ